MNLSGDLNLLGVHYEVEKPTRISHSSFLNYCDCQRLYALAKLLRVPYKVSPIMEVGQQLSGLLLSPTPPPMVEGDITGINKLDAELHIVAHVSYALRDKLGEFTPEVHYSRALVAETEAHPPLILEGYVDGDGKDCFLELKYTGDRTGLNAFSSIPLTYQKTTYFYLTGHSKCVIGVLIRPKITDLIKRFTRIETAIHHQVALARKSPGYYLKQHTFVRQEYTEYFPQIVSGYKQVFREVWWKLNKGHEFLPNPRRCGTCSMEKVCSTGIIPINQAGTEVLSGSL